MTLEKVAGLAADMIIADMSIAPRIRFAALAIRAAQQNGGKIPDQYSKELIMIEAKAESAEIDAILEAKIREETGENPPPAAA